jgi:hypothetical protein
MLLLVNSNHIATVIENHKTSAGRALVNCRDVF